MQASGIVTGKARVVMAAGFAGALTLACVWLGPVIYEENDDMVITALLKGMSGIAPGGEGVFISPVLGFALYSAYKLYPAAPWFSLLLYAGLASCCFSATLTMLRVMEGAGGKIAGLLAVGVFVSAVAMRISFTSVSLMLWVVGCALLLAAIKRDESHGWVPWFAVGQMALAYLLRPDLAPVFALPAIPLLLALLRKNVCRQALRILAPLPVVVLAGLLCGVFVRSGEAYGRYREFNQVRAIFHDTSRGSITAATDQALRAAGWNLDDYFVLKAWWLHDGELFSAGKIRQFLDVNAGQDRMFVAAAAKQRFADYSRLLLLLFVWGLLLVGTADKERGRLAWFGVFAGMFLAVFLLMGIRFPPRIAVPCFFMLLLYGSVLLAGPVGRGRFRAIVGQVGAVAIAGGILAGFLPVFRELRAAHPGRLQIKSYVDRSLLAVVAANGPDTLLVDVDPDQWPVSTFPFQEHDPVMNIPVLATGWLVGSPMYLEQLRKAGLAGGAAVVPAMIDNRKIVLRFWASPNISVEGYVRGTFLKHLRHHYDVPGSGRTVELKPFMDFRQGGNGAIYFHLVTVPV